LLLIMGGGSPGRTDFSADLFFESSEFFAVGGQLVEQAIARFFILCVAQQSPEVVLPFGQRNQPGHIVAIGGDRRTTVIVHSHPFTCQACG
jgi:hypothetical protein